jgi:hypothetical protein
MASPSLRALGTVLNTSTGTPSFAAPAGAVSTDIILVGFFIDDGTRTVTAAPSGFTQAGSSPQRTSNSTSPQHSLAVYWGRFSDVGSGPYGFTVSTSAFIEGRAAAIQGCITTGNPLEATSGNALVGSTSTTAPAVSASSLDVDRYAFYMATNWSGGAWTPPTGYTERWDANDEVLTYDDLALPTATTTSPQAVCASTSQTTAWLGIFMPPAVAASATLWPRRRGPNYRR